MSTIHLVTTCFGIKVKGGHYWLVLNWNAFENISWFDCLVWIRQTLMVTILGQVHAYRPVWSLLLKYTGTQFINTLRPRQDGRLFPDDIFKSIFFNENVQFLIKMSLTFVPVAPINNIPALVQIMAWRRPGNKPLSEPMMVSLLMHICVTRPQWVNSFDAGEGIFWLWGVGGTTMPADALAP